MSNNSKPIKGWINLLVFFVIAAAVFALYAPSISGPYRAEEELFISNNAFIRDWNNIFELFKREIGPRIGLLRPTYRPLAVITYVFEYSLWGADMRGFQLFNLLLHVFVAFSLYALSRLLFDDTFYAFLAAFFFAVHPAQAQTVISIFNRADLLAILLLLVSFLTYIKGTLEETKVDFSVCVICYCAALFTREYAVLFLFLIIAYHFYLKRRLHSKEFLIITCFSLAYLFLRLLVVKPAATSLSLRQPAGSLPGFFALVTAYLRRLMVPLALPWEPEIAGARWFDFPVLAGIALVVLLLWFAFKRKTKSLALPFAINWFLLGLCTFFALYPLASRTKPWFYFASAGAFLIFSRFLCFVCRSPKQRVAGIVLTVLFACGYLYLTFTQVCYRQEPARFFTPSAYSPF